MDNFNEKKQPSSLEAEYTELKRVLYRKFSMYMILAFSAAMVIDLMMTLVSGSCFPLIVVSCLLVLGSLLSKVKRQILEKQELLITIFHIIFYMACMIGHYYGNPQYFQNPLDAFYLSYTCAVFERVVASRMPSASHRIVFSTVGMIVRVTIVPFHEKTILIIQLFCLVFTIYLDLDQEKNDKKLFGSYFYSKEQLNKFKDLVVEYIPEGIVILSHDLVKCLFVNNSFKDLTESHKSDIRSDLRYFKLRGPLGSTTESLEHNSFDDQTLLTFLEENFFLRHNAAEQKKLSCYLSYTKIEKKQNLIRIFEAKVTTIEWDERPAIAIILHDVTQQDTILQLQVAADANKDKLLATVSHELRTPLNGILGMIQIMLKRVNDRELLQYLEICKNSATLLLSLVNSILDLNQIRANKLKLNLENVNVQELLREIVSLFQFQCTQKNIMLNYDISLSLQKILVTDRNRLSQILINLLGNAVKFTNKGSIMITAKESNKKGFIEFSVEDTGIGIKEDDKRKLFQMFGKIEHENRQMNSQGVGLGLTISDNLAKLLCDNSKLEGIKVESQYGKGSVFTFLIKSNISIKNKHIPELDLNLAVNGLPEEPKGLSIKLNSYVTPAIKQFPNYQSNSLRNFKTEPANPSWDNTSCSDGVILIVDDNPFNVTVASHLISLYGYQTRSAFSGQAAIDLIVNNDHKFQPIKLILMDCQMPTMDGYETTKQLRKLMIEKKIPKIPIIALTANDSIVDRETSKKSGMCDYLTKPLTDGSLLRVINKYCKEMPCDMKTGC